MYQAVICKISTRPHLDADKIKLGTCLGNQVVVGIDTEDGQLGVFFPTDGQLSEEFCKAHDLIAYKDEQGNRRGGFFDHRRRVRSQKFRGEKSDGFWCPVEHLAFTGYDISKLAEGDVFTELGGVPICNKYLTQATAQARQRSPKSTRRETPMFPAHVETEQFRYYVDRIPKGALLSFTLKMHGTSARIAHTLDDTVPTLWERVKTFVTRRPHDRKAWTYLQGSRNVILERRQGDGFYGSEEFRYNATQRLQGNLHKGEIVYGEIVGWIDGTRPIMAAVKTEVLKSKEIAKTYGDVMTYKYGCPAGTCKFYVYRIAYATEDGHVIDLPWHAVKARCAELGVPWVPDLREALLYNGDPQSLREAVEVLSEGPDPLDASHIREGVVVRVDHGNTVDFYKQKSWTFGVLEGYIKERDDYVDTEESA